MEEKIYETKLSLNVQTEKKIEFIHSILIPVIEDIRTNFRSLKLFIKRSIEIGPIISIYYTSVTSEDASKINDILGIAFKTYVEDNKKDFQEQDIYLKEKSNIARMNGLQNKGSFINYSTSFTGMDHLKRHGEYNSIYEEEVFNSWLFNNGQLLEETIKTLITYSPLEKRKFIISIFFHCSRKLNDVDLNGYLSFKSHYLGFISANKKMISYHEMFKKQFKKEKSQNAFKWKCDVDKGFYLVMDENREELLDKWRKALNNFVDDIAQVKKLNKGILSSLHMLKFRNISNFHKKAFAVKNLSYYTAREFQAYRRLVNLTYLLLPTLGFNTIDRLYCSVCLIKVIEGEIYNDQAQVQG